MLLHISHRRNFNGVSSLSSSLFLISWNEQFRIYLLVDAYLESETGIAQKYIRVKMTFCTLTGRIQNRIFDFVLCLQQQKQPFFFFFFSSCLGDEPNYLRNVVLSYKRLVRIGSAYGDCWEYTLDKCLCTAMYIWVWTDHFDCLD